jgi:hypothetical protein
VASLQACLLMLYCGLAFYEYDENTFWPQFLSDHPKPANGYHLKTGQRR